VIPLYLATAAFVAGLAIGGAGTWKVQAWRHDANELERQQKIATDLQRTSRATFRLQENRDAESIRINDRLADALERLRSRPERRAAAATPACEGSTGAQLSGPDGGFLEREAARADQLREALRQCYGWIDAVRGEVTAAPSETPAPPQ
jgi:hypothetical protein